MHKTAFTILFLIFNVCSLAQEKQFEYTDSTLLMETQTLEEPNSDVDENDIDNNDSAGEILSDTTLYIYPIKISPDSVVGWKNESSFLTSETLTNSLKKSNRKISVNIQEK